MEMKVTWELLRRMGACAPQWELFEDLHPDGIVVNVKNAKRVITAGVFSWWWFIHNLMELAKVDIIYYTMDTTTARIEHQGRLYELGKEYEKAKAAAYDVLAGELNNTNKAYLRGLMTGNEMANATSKARKEHIKALDKLTTKLVNDKFKSEDKFDHDLAVVACKCIRMSWKDAIKALKETGEVS